MILECILIVSSLCRTLKDKPVLALYGADVAIKLLDVQFTETARRKCGLTPGCLFVEHDPFVRQLVEHPAADYAYEMVYALGAAWLGHKMRTSRHRFIRSVWWAPQLISFNENLYAYVDSRRHSTANR